MEINGNEWISFNLFQHISTHFNVYLITILLNPDYGFYVITVFNSLH